MKTSRLGHGTGATAVDVVARIPAPSAAVEIPAGAAMLAGELIVPAAARGLVMFAHGSGSSRFSPRNQFVAGVLREAGHATLLFDLLTEEEERADAVHGHLRFDIGLLAERLEAAALWALRMKPTSKLRLGFFGSSTGGAAALVAAAALGEQVDAIVSRGGRPDLALHALQVVKAATLLLVGERDEEVLEMNQLALARLRCEKELLVVPGATHLFEEAGALEFVAERAAHWFGRHWREGGP